MTAERLHKIIAAAGLASRREAERWIAEGRVRVDGQLVTRPGLKVDAAKAKIEVDGQRLGLPRPHVWLALYKPRGYVTTSRDPRGRPTVFELLGDAGTIRGQKRVFYVGRLDMDSEGLLLLTSDGQLAHRLTHPTVGVPRRYRLKIEGKLGKKDLESLRQGVLLEDGYAKVEQLRVQSRPGNSQWVEVVVREGRNRLLRRLFAALGLRVLRLVRVEYAGVKLGGLEPGQFRSLSRAEQIRLRQAVGVREAT